MPEKISLSKIICGRECLEVAYATITSGTKVEKVNEHLPALNMEKDGRYTIIDGTHRLIEMAIKGFREAECDVETDSEEYRDREEPVSSVENFVIRKLAPPVGDYLEVKVVYKINGFREHRPGDYVEITGIQENHPIAKEDVYLMSDRTYVPIESIVRGKNTHLKMQQQCI